MLLRNKPCNWLERVAIHIMIVLSIYFSVGSRQIGFMNNIQLAVLLLSVLIIVMLFAGDMRKSFVGSPLDFLLIATAIVIPNLPQSPISDHSISILILKLIILFYCVEYVLFNVTRNWWAIRATLTMSALLPLTLSFV